MMNRCKRCFKYMVEDIDIISKFCLDCSEMMIDEEVKSIPEKYRN